MGLIFFILIAYAVLAVLPARFLRPVRFFAAIPVFLFLFLLFCMLAIAVDGVDGLREVGAEIRDLWRELPGFFQDARDELKL